MTSLTLSIPFLTGLFHNETEAENTGKYVSFSLVIAQFCFETFLKNSFGLAGHRLGISESGKKNTFIIQ